MASGGTLVFRGRKQNLGLKWRDSFKNWRWVVEGVVAKSGAEWWRGWWQNLALWWWQRWWHKLAGWWQKLGVDLTRNLHINREPVCVTCAVTCQGRFLLSVLSPASPVFVTCAVTCFSGFRHLCCHLLLRFSSPVASPVLSPVLLPAPPVCVTRPVTRFSGFRHLWFHLVPHFCHLCRHLSCHLSFHLLLRCLLPVSFYRVR